MVITRQDLTKKYYKPGDVAELLNVHPKTVQSWDNKGELVFSRTNTNRRYLSKEDLIEYLKVKNLYYETDNNDKRDVVYARVSTSRQVEQGDLDRQVIYIINKVEDLKNPLILKEQGRGLNSKRKKILKLIDLIQSDKINRIYITYKERLTRFGYEYIEKICIKHGVKIIALQEQEEKTTEEELVEDFMSLLASFSGKLYGLRSHSNK